MRNWTSRTRSTGVRDLERHPLLEYGPPEESKAAKEHWRATPPLYRFPESSRQVQYAQRVRAVIRLGAARKRMNRFSPLVEQPETLVALHLLRIRNAAYRPPKHHG